MAWFVIDAVGVMDLDGVLRGLSRRTATAGRRYEPSMMVALLLYGWAAGCVRRAGSSAPACEDVACRVIAAQQRARSRDDRALRRPPRARAGRAVRRGARALRGGRPGHVERGRDRRHQGRGQRQPRAQPSTTSRSRARSWPRQIATDAAEDERFGEARGDELPPELARAGPARLAARGQAPARRAARGARQRRSRARGPSASKDAKRRLDEELLAERRANAAYEAYRARGRRADGRRFGRPPTQALQPPATPPGKINITDPDSGWSRACAAGCRATTPRRSATSSRS